MRMIDGLEIYNGKDDSKDSSVVVLENGLRIVYGEDNNGRFYDAEGNLYTFYGGDGKVSGYTRIVGPVNM